MKKQWLTSVLQQRIQKNSVVTPHKCGVVSTLSAGEQSLPPLAKLHRDYWCRVSSKIS